MLCGLFLVYILRIVINLATFQQHTHNGVFKYFIYTKYTLNAPSAIKLILLMIMVIMVMIAKWAIEWYVMQENKSANELYTLKTSKSKKTLPGAFLFRNYQRKLFYHTCSQREIWYRPKQMQIYTNHFNRTINHC